jgi:hypothetical protein
MTHCLRHVMIQVTAAAVAKLEEESAHKASSHPAHSIPLLPRQ